MTTESQNRETEDAGPDSHDASRRALITGTVAIGSRLRQLAPVRRLR
jgi:hypothetical protein